MRKLGVNPKTIFQCLELVYKSEIAKNQIALLRWLRCKVAMFAFSIIQHILCIFVKKIRCPKFDLHRLCGLKVGHCLFGPASDRKGDRCFQRQV